MEPLGGLRSLGDVGVMLPALGVADGRGADVVVQGDPPHGASVLADGSDLVGQELHDNRKPQLDALGEFDRLWADVYRRFSDARGQRHDLRRHVIGQSLS